MVEEPPWSSLDKPQRIHNMLETSRSITWKLIFWVGKRYFTALSPTRSLSSSSTPITYLYMLLVARNCITTTYVAMTSPRLLEWVISHSGCNITHWCNLSEYRGNLRISNTWLPSTSLLMEVPFLDNSAVTITRKHVETRTSHQSSRSLDSSH